MNCTETDEDDALCDVCGDSQLLPGSKGPCAECGGTGWLISNVCFSPEIERCDACEKYEDDLDAAAAYLNSKASKHWLDKIVLKPKRKKEIEA